MVTQIASQIGSIDFLVSLVGSAVSTSAARVVLGGESESVQLCDSSSAVLKTLGAEASLLSSLLGLLHERSFPWPDGNDALFSTGTIKRRLFFAPESDSPFLATVLTEPARGKLLPGAIIDDISRVEIQPLLERLFASPAVTIHLAEVARNKRGLVLVHSAAKSLIIDAPAIITALVPNALYARDVTGRAVLEAVLHEAQSRVVVVGVVAHDPVEMILEFRSLLQGSPELEDLFLTTYTLSFVHRRVRRICGNCARSSLITPAIAGQLPSYLAPSSEQSYLFGRGCEKCGQSAYRGSIGLSSLAAMTSQLQDALRVKADIGTLTEIAYGTGTRSLLEDGLEKIGRGLTSFEEVLAVAPRPSPSFEAVIMRHRHKPAQPEPLDTALMSAGENLFGSGSVRRSVLLIEDDLDQLEILRVVFQQEGYRVLCAKGGAEGLATLEDERVDVVVCDLMMPGMDGEQFVVHLRAHPRLSDIPVLILTALEDEDREHRALSEGADDYCSKSVKRKILLKRVERLLQRRRANPVTHLLER
jgi:CheY-like chemotaxis protein